MTKPGRRFWQNIIWTGFVWILKRLPLRCFITSSWTWTSSLKNKIFYFTVSNSVKSIFIERREEKISFQALKLANGNWQRNQLCFMVFLSSSYFQSSNKSFHNSLYFNLNKKEEIRVHKRPENVCSEANFRNKFVRRFWQWVAEPGKENINSKQY